LTTRNPPSLNHADVSLLFLQPSGLATVLGISHSLPALKTIVTIGALHGETKNILELWSKQNNIKVFELTERTSIHYLEIGRLLKPNTQVEESGAKNPLAPPVVTADTIATICYTSVGQIRHIFIPLY
jgi:hypothetical protein